LRRLLLDQSAPWGLRQVLTAFDVKSAYDMGWDRVANGLLLTAAEQAGFSILLSADQNIWHQNRMAGRKIALVVLGTNHWDTIKRDTRLVIEACDRAGEGAYVIVPYPKPPRRRRPFPPSGP
jgi:hypothetical protein